MWRDEKSEYLRKNRDYSRLLNVDDAQVQTPRSQNRGSKVRKFDEENDDVSRERQEYLNRRRRLKELERQKLTKGTNGLYVNRTREEASKASDQIKDHGGTNVTGDAGPVFFKDKKKLPYDRSFGSFFGPSEPVVAKRIIEEARAREEAEIVAATEAKAIYEAECKKSFASSSAEKSSGESRPTQRPCKLVDKVTEKAQKLKEARDYSFLFDDSPLPVSKTAEKKGPTCSKLGGDARLDVASAQANNPLFAVPRFGPFKETVGETGSDRPTISSRPLQSQLNSSQLWKPSPNRSSHDRIASHRPQNRSKVFTSANPLPSKVASADLGWPDLRKETHPRKKAMMRKLVAGSTTVNGYRSNLLVSCSQSFLKMGRQTAQIVERRLSQATVKCPAQPAERQPALATDMHPAQCLDRRPLQSTDRRPAQSVEKQPAHATDPSPVASQASERCGVVSQGLKKGATAGVTFRPVASGTEPRRHVPVYQAGRQNLRPKSARKGTSHPALSNHNRARCSDDPRQGEIPCKRARSPSEELDALPTVSVNMMKIGSPVEEDDAFIDDENDAANVSSMIHSIMGYNPNKYHGNDDFDDRSMEVGFHTIQAEERRSAREARLEDERELALIEAEEKAERLRKAKKKRKQSYR